MGIVNTFYGFFPFVKMFLFISAGYRFTSADDNHNENYSPVYGKDWVLFPDDDGGLHFANLSFIPAFVGTAQRNVYFHLYTKRNSDDYEELLIEGDAEVEFFEPEHPIKFITHGWMSDGDSSTVLDIKDAYLRKRAMNAIVVDWHEIAADIVYVIAATSTRHVGYKVAQMAGRLVDRFNVSGDQMHLIGHSLGAHVMGFAGKELQKNNITAARITGLDPARPLFELPPTGGLSSADARFVDIVHTCGGVLGYRTSHGHADFYPNDGEAPQPGCDGLAQLVDACSHARAHQYFAESINSEEGFVSFPCSSYEDYAAAKCRNDSVLMGDPADTSSRGDYYLHTNSEAKYARGNDVDEENGDK